MTEPSELTKALAAFQAALPHIAKGNTAEVPTKNGGKYKYDYADLTDVSEVILPLLAQHGMAWTALPTYSEFGFALHYELRHESGEKVEGYYPLPSASPQEIGSAVTYARRYALCAATGVAPGGDDDDAAKAQSSITAIPAGGRATRPPAQERIDKAIQAIQEASTAAELHGVWERVRRGGLDGVGAIPAIYEAREKALAGTEGALVDHWAAAEVPQ